jgi:chorismate mutase
MTDNPMAPLRAQINALDDQIIRLIAERYALLADVVKVKAAHNIPHHVPARVAEVLARNEATAVAAGLPQGLVRNIYSLIIDAAHEYERANLSH